MNAQDRRKLAKMIGEAQIALGVLDEVRTALQDMAGDEAVKFDNMCERGLEDSEMAQSIEEAQGLLEEGESGVDEAHSALELALCELEGLVE